MVKYKKFMRWLFIKYYGLTLPHSFRHMMYIRPYLKVTEHDDSTKSFTYRKKFLARSMPVSLLKQYRDDEIFVIGSGPSLNSQDLSKLADKTVVLMNGSYHLASEIAFTQVIYIVTDFDFIRGHPELVFRALKSNACCIFPSDCVRAICDIDPDILRRCPFIAIDDIQRVPNLPMMKFRQFEQWASQQTNIHYDISRSTKDHFIGFSENLQLGFFRGGTVMYVALQIACYLNPQRLYIMGFDIGNSSQPRFYESSDNKKPSHLLQDYQRFIEPAVRLFSEKVLPHKQLTVYNLSPVSKLPRSIIPFLDYETLM
jgi:Kdo-III transferase WaaZ